MNTFFTLCFVCFILLSPQYLWAETIQLNPSSYGSVKFYSKTDIDKAVEPLIEDGFQGTIIISNENATIYRRSAGFAIEEVADYTSSTVVDIASVSKQFTAAAIMKLVEQGKLKISDRITNFFLDVPEDKARITIHALMTHTAGFKRHSGRDEDKLSRSAFIQQVLRLPLAFGVEETYHYSNIGYGLLAAIVEKVSGQDFETFLFEHLFKPAGMLSTGYLRPDWSDRTIPEVKRLYAGYSSPLDMLNGTDGDFWNLIGGGGIFSTADDMARWHKALITHRVLSKRSQTLMYTPHINENDPGYYYGYGWSVVPREGKEPLIWHNGMSFFGKAEYWRLPQSGIMIFVATHTQESSPWHVANAIYKALEL